MWFTFTRYLVWNWFMSDLFFFFNVKLYMKACEKRWNSSENSLKCIHKHFSPISVLLHHADLCSRDTLSEWFGFENQHCHKCFNYLMAQKTLHLHACLTTDIWQWNSKFKAVWTFTGQLEPETIPHVIPSPLQRPPSALVKSESTLSLPGRSSGAPWRRPAERRGPHLPPSHSLLTSQWWFERELRPAHVSGQETLPPPV